MYKPDLQSEGPDEGRSPMTCLSCLKMMTDSRISKQVLAGEKSKTLGLYGQLEA